MGERGQVHILETTIRDGGYEIAHQFVEEDIALVVSVLDAAGVQYIEVGHGMGVGTQTWDRDRPKSLPLAGDDAHMTAARAAAARAKVGVIFVAGEGFGPVEYLDRIRGAGMDFVRLAFFPSDLHAANLRYVEHARELGLVVSINLMQTYVLPPEEVGRRSAETRRAGADWFYVVDSAGGMSSQEVGDYVRAIREASDIAAGLHAHNNMGLAVANCLAAIEAGATMVDCTLNGIGRATGNPPTEQLLLALQRMGHETEIILDPITTLANLYRPFLEAKGQNPLDFVSGAAMVHSRNVPAILGKARELGLSPVDFLVRVGREARARSCLDQLEFPPEIFDAAARSCKTARAPEPTEASVAAVESRLAAAKGGADLDHACETLTLKAARCHRRSVLHLVPSDRFPFAGLLPWESEDLVGLSMAWRPASAPWPAADRLPDYLLLDRSLAASDGLPDRETRRLLCSWEDLWLEATRLLVEALLGGEPTQVWSPAPEDALSARAVERLTASGIPVSPHRGGGPAVAVARGDQARAWLPLIRQGDVVVFLDRGLGSARAADEVRRAGGQALCPAIGPAIAARAQALVSLALARRGAIESSDGPWVHPLVAPRVDQATVDLSTGAIIDFAAEPSDDIVRQVAYERVRLLLAGTGRP